MRISKNEKVAVDYYEPYARYSDQLRNWVGAYSVGCLALLISSDSILNTLKNKELAKLVAIWMILAVSLQLILVLINKTIMWSEYYGEEVDAQYKNTLRYKILNHMSNTHSYDFVFDVMSIIFLGFGTFNLYKVFGL